MKNKPYILCAAIHWVDGPTSEHLPKNLKKGLVICGRRHHNCFSTLFAFDLDYDKSEINQGFISSDDRFLTRKQAAKMAFKFGQIDKPANCLVSEDLY